MKIFSFIISIICIISFFSSPVSAKLQEWKIDKLLDIPGQIFTQELSQSVLEKRNFKQKRLQNHYLQFQHYNSQLQTALIQEYRAWKLKNHQLWDIALGYKNFIFHANNAFLYHQIEEQAGRSPETLQALTQSYEQMRTTYIQLKYAVYHR